MVNGVTINKQWLATLVASKIAANILAAAKRPNRALPCAVNGRLPRSPMPAYRDSSAALRRGHVMIEPPAEAVYYKPVASAG
jgi:hypothetical protein